MNEVSLTKEHAEYGFDKPMTMHADHSTWCACHIMK